MHYNNVPTLRTSNNYIFVMSTDDLEEKDDDRDIFRFLHPIERLPLQGFNPKLALHFNKKSLLRAAGNAYPTNLMAAVLLPILCSLKPLGNWPYGLHNIPKTLVEKETLEVSLLDLAFANVPQRKYEPIKIKMLKQLRSTSSSTTMAIQIRLLQSNPKRQATASLSIAKTKRPRTD